MAKLLFIFEVESKKEIFGCLNIKTAALLASILVLVLCIASAITNLTGFNLLYLLISDCLGFISAGFILLSILYKKPNYVKNGSFLFTIYTAIYTLFAIFALLYMFIKVQIFYLATLLTWVIGIIIVYGSHYVFLSFEDNCGDVLSDNLI